MNRKKIIQMKNDISFIEAHKQKLIYHIKKQKRYIILKNKREQ